MRPLLKQTPTDVSVEFEREVNKYLQQLKRYCLSLGKTKWDGEDLMQETLIKAYKSWLNRPNEITKAYLFRIASNTWIDHYRKRKPEEDMKQDMSLFEQVVESSQDRIFRIVEILLKELTPKQRVTLILVDGFCYSAKESGKMIVESEGSVKASLHRARKKIQLSNVQESDDYILGNEEAITYVTALQDGNSTRIVTLYQKEVKQPQMAASGFDQVYDIPKALTSIGGCGTSYVVVTFHTKDGKKVFVPFYQSELSTLLLQGEGMKTQLPLSV
ncbi:RNA polymerase sigma factor [Aquibacillus halophilus]|nr:RNA polymerase sigma factor [Aquibacillus halophilus]